MDIRNFFQVSPNDPLDGRASSQIGSNISFQFCHARELNTLHEQQNVKKKRQKTEKIKKSVAVPAWKFGIPAARKLAAKV